MSPSSENLRFNDEPPIGQGLKRPQYVVTVIAAPRLRFTKHLQFILEE